MAIRTRRPRPSAYAAASAARESEIGAREDPASSFPALNQSTTSIRRARRRTKVFHARGRDAARRGPLTSTAGERGERRRRWGPARVSALPARGVLEPERRSRAAITHFVIAHFALAADARGPPGGGRRTFLGRLSGSESLRGAPSTELQRWARRGGGVVSRAARSSF